MPIFAIWRRWIRPLVTLLYIAILLIALPLMIVEFQVHGVEKHLQAWFIGGLFVLMAVPISIWGILQHLIHYTQPSLQRHIVRILWMVPIYAANAWFALRFKDVAKYLDVARECYEAYVIYNFMIYLLSFLRAEYPDLHDTIGDKEQVKHLFPICWCPPWPMGGKLINNCKHGVLQYTVVRPITTIAAFICQLSDVYEEGKFSPTNAWVYIMGINNISQIWAMYCLVLFYKATKEELAPIKPLPKFMCVKAVVFLSFWQSVFIAFLAEVGAIKPNTKWEDFTLQDVSTGLQDFLICIEMFLAAIAHYYSFSHRPYVDYARGHQNCCASFTSMWDVSDVRDDVVDHVRTVGKRAQKVVTRPLHRKPQGTNTERAPLLRESSAEHSDTYNTYETTPTDERAREYPDELYSVLDKPLSDSENEAANVDPGPSTSRANRLTSDNASIHTYESSMMSDTKSLTTSMNNYAQFSDASSQDFPVPPNAGKVVGAIVAHRPTTNDIVTSETVTKGPADERLVVERTMDDEPKAEGPEIVEDNPLSSVNEANGDGDQNSQNEKQESENLIKLL